MEPPLPGAGTDDAVRRWVARTVVWVLGAALAGVAWVTTWEAVELTVVAQPDPVGVGQVAEVAPPPTATTPAPSAVATPTTAPTPTAGATPAASAASVASAAPAPASAPARDVARPSTTAPARRPATPTAPARRSTPLTRAAAAKAVLQREREAARELAALARTLPASLALWTNPLAPGYRITALFGASGDLWSRDHTGLDLAVPTGTPVHATAAGVVSTAGDAGAYGQRVTITHDGGTETWYAHLSRIDVEPGQSVSSGDVIGAVGATGNVTGPHLHLEVRPAGGDPVDPVDALDDHGVDVRS